MIGYTQILEKLNRFTGKYYRKMLVKGLLLFIAFGVLFFFAVLLIEYMLWLNPTWRFLLFMVFIGFELLLFFRYIATPIFYLLKLKKGISTKEASLLIGKHFPEVGDRLYNLLELAEDKNRTELLLASIAQRSENMNPIPFTNAVDYRENIKYTKFLVFPVLVFALIWLSGNLADFFGSVDRVVHYNVAYEPPAPFSFQLLSNDLKVLENEPYTIEVNTVGELQPETVFMELGGLETAMKKQNGRYQYELTPPLTDTNFFFYANGVRSKTYSLKVLKTPLILDFRIELDYPNYLGKNSEFITGTGNATFPEGTKATWVIASQNTDEIRLNTIDTILAFNKNQPEFRLSKTIYSDLAYELMTSNQNVTNYEKLAYRFNVIKDGYPNIKVNEVKDSLNPNISYYIGEASDDYKLNSIKLAYFPKENRDEEQVIQLASPNKNFEQFYYTFPSGLQLEPGTAYSFYFMATDNDGIRKGKTTKSQIFSMDILDDVQLKNKELEAQQSLIKNLDRSLGEYKEQKESLKEINKLQKEKNQLNFNDQDQIRSFLEKQERQENMMQKFSKQLQQNLNKENKDDKLNKLLQERLERQEIQAKKNEKLLEELNKIADKINKEELTKRLDELGKKQQTSERNLEQLLELTKRYYVTEKAEQLARDLEKEAKMQEELSKLKAGQDFTDKEQKKLNDDFKRLSEELDELIKDNGELKKPLQLHIDKDKQAEIKNDQQEALENIKEQQSEEEAPQSHKGQKAAARASEKQKSAAEKMKQMSEDLQQAASASGGESSDAEDAEMLRQVLDNLVTFSFKQESLYDKLEEADAETASFSSTVRAQQELRTLFEHVDDSLFALSLRRAELSEFVNEQITEVYYNMDKTLESLAESQIYQGVSYQKYVLNASNSLADFLAHILDNMQQSMMSGQGQGQGQDFQLPDIIKGQSELQEKMKGMGQSGEGEPKPGEGKGSKGKGEQEGKGEPTSEGGSEQGKEGQSNSEKGEKGSKEGQGGGSSGGQGQGEPSEAELREIYEIYKEQQQLKEELERQLKNMINSGDKNLGEKLLRQMEDFQNALLENGITQRTMDKVNRIQYELLKLENAALKQGKKSERESSTNKKDFQNPIITKPSLLENFRNEVEILNREGLPLREDFRYRVKEYFKTDD